MATKIESYSGAQREFVPEQYKQSTKLLGLIDAALTQCDAAEDALHELTSGLSPETAVGPALDYRGALVGITRAIGESDDHYRTRILIGTGTEGLPTYEALRRVLQLEFGQTEIGLYPIWPAGLYYVLYEHSEPNLPENLESYFTSGTEVVQGTFLCCEDGEDYELIVLEDNGQPLVIDQRWPDTTYAIVDSDGYIIVDDGGAAVTGVDYLTSQESVETN